jgi:soluble lytic murein transglycosylase-like protein
MKSTLVIRFWLGLVLAVSLPWVAWALRPRPAVSPASSGAPQTAETPVSSHAAARLVDAIIQIESNGDPRMVGRQGERGLMQIKAETWQEMTRKMFGTPLPFDRAFEPTLNRRVGTAYLAHLQERILPRQAEWRADERSLLLAGYNAGPGRLCASGFDLARLPRQTRDYVERASALHDFLLDDLAGRIRQSRSSPL